MFSSIQGNDWLPGRPRSGAYEVSIERNDGSKTLIFSKLELFRFPTNQEIFEAISQFNKDGSVPQFEPATGLAGLIGQYCQIL